jgi:predicted lipoprotein with Yx(FWY)xxD motif
MKIPFRIGALVFGVGLVLSACSSSGYGGTSMKTGAKTSPTTAPAAAAAGAVKTAQSSLGTILVDAQGRTLYGFANDVNGTPTCDTSCLSIWPAFTTHGAPKPSAGLNGTQLTTVPRDDGSSQVKAGKWPLYLFSGDTKAGDVNGQGVENFFVVSPDGSLIKS